jgi:hypothetical protein
MDNVLKVNYCTKEPSSQTFRSYLNLMSLLLTSPYIFLVWCLIEHMDNITF